MKINLKTILLAVAFTTALVPLHLSAGLGDLPVSKDISVPIREHEPEPRFWFGAEYLLWWTSGDSFPPVATTGPLVNPEDQSIFTFTAGFPSREDTTVLFGDQDDSLRSGFRINGGFWFNQERNLGISGRYYMLENEGGHFHFDCDEFDVLLLPFIDTMGAERAFITCFPAQPGENIGVEGEVGLSTSSRFRGWDMDVLYNLSAGRSSRLNAIAGFRQTYLNEDFVQHRFEEFFFGGVSAGATRRFDQFSTRNRFDGVDLGVQGEWRCNRWSVQATARIALGVNSQIVDIEGSTLDVNANATLPGGSLALVSNIGMHCDSTFSLIPELTLETGYQLTDNWRAFLGYNFLYWTSVVRPGHEIDPVLDESAIPIAAGVPINLAATRPEVRFNDTDFWAQGLNFGLEFRF